MWSVISTVAVVTVLISMWFVGADHLKQQGRGFFFRNWIGGAMACFFAIVTSVLFYADAWYWNAAGLALVGLSVNALIKILRQQQARNELNI